MTRKLFDANGIPFALGDVVKGVFTSSAPGGSGTTCINRWSASERGKAATVAGYSAISISKYPKSKPVASISRGMGVTIQNTR